MHYLAQGKEMALRVGWERIGILFGPTMSDHADADQDWRGQDWRTLKASASRAADQSASCIVVDASAVSASHSLFEGNEGGDVIVARMSSTVDLVHTTFKGNAVSDESAAARDWEALDTRGCQGGTKCWLAQYGQNKATVSLWEGSVATLATVSFLENRGTAAGGIFLAHLGTTAMLDQVEFARNQATDPNAAGGAIFVGNQATVSGMRSLFKSNTAASLLAAGAVFVIEDAKVTLTNTTLSHNRAKGHKIVGSLFGSGAIYSDGSAVRLTHATIDDNEADDDSAADSSSANDGPDSPMAFKLP